VIGKALHRDDFVDKFGLLEGAIALDLDDRFVRWKSIITQSIANKSAEVWELLDAMIVY